MPDDHFEREVNEILDNIERFPGPGSRRSRARKRAIRRIVNWIADARWSFARRLAAVSMGQVMLAAFLMILGSFFFRRFNPLLMQWVLVAGVMLFISAFAIMVLTGGVRGGAQYWRGRQTVHRLPPLGQRLRRWFTSRRRNQS